MVDYMDYIDQGLIAPLPDGWEENYRNLYERYAKTGTYYDLLVDGKTYIINEFLNMVNGVNVGVSSFVRDEEAQKYVWIPGEEAEDLAQKRRFEGFIAAIPQQLS